MEQDSFFAFCEAVVCSIVKTSKEKHVWEMMFYKQIILQKGLPFDVKLPEHPPDKLFRQTALFSFTGTYR